MSWDLGLFDNGLRDWKTTTTKLSDGRVLSGKAARREIVRKRNGLDVDVCCKSLLKEVGPRKISGERYRCSN